MNPLRSDRFLRVATPFCWVSGIILIAFNKLTAGTIALSLFIFLYTCLLMNGNRGLLVKSIQDLVKKGRMLDEEKNKGNDTKSDRESVKKR